MSRAPRKPRAKKNGTQVQLPPPRPLYGLAAELYELLVADLDAVIEQRSKATRRLDSATQALDTAQKREKRLRNQLATFAPALEGFEHDSAAADQAAAAAIMRASQPPSSPPPPQGEGDAPAAPA